AAGFGSGRGGARRGGGKIRAGDAAKGLKNPKSTRHFARCCGTRRPGAPLFAQAQELQPPPPMSSPEETAAVNSCAPRCHGCDGDAGAQVTPLWFVQGRPPLSGGASRAMLAAGFSFRLREDRMDTLSHAAFTRRSVLRSAARAGLAAAAVPPLALLAGAAKAANTRGIVGVIKPRATDSSLVDMIKLLPEGIGVVPVYLNLTRGSREEYG